MPLFKKKLIEPELSQYNFKKKYPNYSYGLYSYGVPEVFDWKEGSTLKIGVCCSISSYFKIYLGGHHRVDWVSSYPFPAFTEEAKDITGFGGTNGDVIIGSDVWIAANVTILSGVTIGHGAVIANGSVITKDVTPYEIVGGNPAKHIRYRFEQSIIDKLLKIAWWEWNEKEIRKVAIKLSSNDIQGFIDYVEKKG